MANSGKTRSIKFPSLSGIRSFTYLDYIFNPCSLLSVDFLLNQKTYREVFADYSYSNTILFSVQIASRGGYSIILSGELVSFTVTQPGDPSSPYLISALVLPSGVARNVSVALDDTNLGKAIQTTSVSVSPVKYPGLSGDQLTVGLTYYQDMSLMSSIMRYRKERTLAWYRQFKAAMAKNSSTPPMMHRLVYVPLRSDASKSEMLYGDLNFTSPAAESRAKLSSVLAPSQFVASSGAQGLLNNAFNYLVNSGNPLYPNFINQNLNEVYRLFSHSELLLGLDSFFYKSAQEWRAFRSFEVDMDFVPPVWGRGYAYHTKTLVQYRPESGTPSPTDFTTQLEFGRFNPTAIRK